MNTILLWAVPAALALALVGWFLLRRPPTRGPRAAPPAPARPDAARPPLAGHNATTRATTAAAAAQPVAPAAAPPADRVAQHQAATEALRQARRRKADDEARQAAERAVQRPVAAATSAAHAAPAPAPGAAAPARRPALSTTTPILPPTRPPLATTRPLPPDGARPAPVVPVLSPLAIQLNTDRARAAAPAGLAPLRTPPRPTRPPTVLVADDSKVVRVKTGRLLEKLGWRVLLADDGQAALRCLDDESPDLLITDVEMPGLDGFALTRQLRDHPRWARLPVIMITSSDDKHRAEAIAAGVDVLLGKPYSEEALVAQARALLGDTVDAGVPALH